MNAGESLWARHVDEGGRVFRWEPHQCPGGQLRSLGYIEVALQVVQTAAVVGIWYELRKSRKVQESILEIESGCFEERRIQWIVQAFKAWIDSHDGRLGLDLPSSIALRKELVGIMNALFSEPRMAVPQVLLLCARDIQVQLQPRSELAFKLIDKYRQYAKNLEDDKKVKPNEVYTRRLWYHSGQERTKRWLSIKTPEQLRKLQSEKDEMGFWDLLFGDKKEIETKIYDLQSHQKITKLYKPFQNFINELYNVSFISRRAKEIHLSLPNEYRRELFLVAEEEQQSIFRKLISKSKPVIDERKGIQKFKVLAVLKDRIT